MKELRYRTIEEREYKQAPTIKITPEEYSEIFDDLFAGGEPILNRFGEELTFEDDEEIQQVYIKGDPVRCEFPGYWFLSSRGNLISVKGTKNPKLFWVLPDLNSYGRLVHKFAYYQDGKRRTRSIKAYNLFGIVYGAEKVGLANQLIQFFGLDAFRYRIVEGHHVKGKDYNTPDKIQFLTGTKFKEYIQDKLGTHESLRILNKDTHSPEEASKAMHAISQEINGPYVAWLRESYKDGDRIDGETSIKPISFINSADYWLSIGRLYDAIVEMLESGETILIPADQN